jgi:(2Fe-2S) ferredoxin
MKDRAKGLGLKNVRINSSGCLDRCELGPSVVIYPEGVWYSCTTKEDIDEVLQTHLVKGDRVERLMLQTADKLPGIASRADLASVSCSSPARGRGQRRERSAYGRSSLHSSANRRMRSVSTWRGTPASRSYQIRSRALRHDPRCIADHPGVAGIDLEPPSVAIDRELGPLAELASLIW